jgi:choloylglycine hydrolase
MNYKSLPMMALGLLTLSLASQSLACSLAFWNDNDQAKITARSMDLYIPEFPQLRLSPPGITRIGDTSKNHLSWQSKYGSLAVTAFKTPAASDGINDQGLAAHLLYLDKTDYGPRNSSLPALSNAFWVQYMLDNFKTVNEALATLDQYQLVATEINDREWPTHLALQDATGDAAIIEYIEGKAVIHHGPEYRVMTNDPTYAEQLENVKKYKGFGGELGLPGEADPMSRFVRASAFLQTLPKPSSTEQALTGVSGVIRTVMVPFGTEDWPTRWITLSDLSNKIYYFSATNSPNVLWVDLSKIKFDHKSRVMMLDPTEIKFTGDVTKHFKTGK